jgi:hypothetical protein
VGTDGAPCTAEAGDDLVPPTDADGMGCPRRGGKRVADVLRALRETDWRMAADVRAPLPAAAYRRGAIDTGCRPLEGLCRDTVDRQGGMGRLQLDEPGQGEGLLGWGERVGRRWSRSLLVGDAWLLEGLVLLIPDAQLGGGRLEGNAHGDGDGGRAQHAPAQAWSPAIATAGFIVACVEMGERVG